MAWRSKVKEPSGSRSTDSRLTRRTALKAVGASGIAGLAGCTGDGGDDTDELFIGIQVPLSGPYGNTGDSVAKAIQLAADTAVEEGQFEEIKTEVKNTETDPDVGRQRAQEHINDGADFLIGNVSSATALSIGELAERNGMVYNCIAGSTAVTGESCRTSTFAWSDEAVMQLGGSLGYVLENDVPDGSDIYMISADYEWGQSLEAWVQNNMVPEYDLNVVGSDFTPFGSSDYSSPLTSANDADPDILMMNMSGTDQITSLPEIQEFGLLEDTTIVYAATNMGDAMSIDQELISHENYWSSHPWYWNHDYSDASREFADQFRERHPDALMDGYIGCFYAATRATLNAIEETGSTSLDDLQGEIEGSTVEPQVWGADEEMRACDHRATIATATVKGKSPDEAEGQDLYEVIEAPDGETVRQRMRSCEETGCNL